MAGKCIYPVEDYSQKCFTKIVVGNEKSCALVFIRSYAGARAGARDDEGKKKKLQAV